MKKILLSILVCFFVVPVFAFNDFIVKFREGNNPNQIKKVFGDKVGVEHRTLVSDLGIYRVKIYSNLADSIALEKVRALPTVEYAQLNHKVTRRQAPNDPSFTKQWSLGTQAVGRVNAQEAWELSTGGFDRLGNQIVIAIIDGGFDLEHPDLKDNYWVNKGEIPNNGKDDDGNGYVDDINGWNASMNNNKIDVDNHGTHVAGIAGAKSNNGMGIAGLNWMAKLMVVSMSGYDTSDVTSAYGYVLKQKKLWHQTKGQKGANVVVTNSSFGVDGADCTKEEFPVWNDMYEQLGQAGVLSAAAAPNMNWNIDVKGDVPSACSSEFIIAVTNSNNKGKLSQMSGYGQKTIDIAAPGENIFSTVAEEYDYATGKTTKYAEYSGTSMATPHVAGTVALMHSIASTKLITDYHNNPAAAALVFKELLLKSVEKSSDFTTLNTSGGRLNLQNTLKASSEY